MAPTCSLFPTSVPARPPEPEADRIKVTSWSCNRNQPDSQVVTPGGLLGLPLHPLNLLHELAAASLRTRSGAPYTAFMAATALHESAPDERLAAQSMPK
jgi:hypothetical protein